MLQRMRELSVQAANDTLTNDDRQKIQEELDALIEEVDRVSAIEFNGAKLFGNNFDFQLGSGSEPSTTLGLRTQQVGSDDLGAYSVHTSSAVDTSVALQSGDLTIVNREGSTVEVRATSAGDDGLSTTNQSGSAIAKAAAINSSAELHGITATVG